MDFFHDDDEDSSTRAELAGESTDNIKQQISVWAEKQPHSSCRAEQQKNLTENQALDAFMLS